MSRRRSTSSGHGDAADSDGFIDYTAVVRKHQTDRASQASSRRRKSKGRPDDDARSGSEHASPRRSSSDRDEVSPRKSSRSSRKRSDKRGDRNGSVAAAALVEEDETEDNEEAPPPRRRSRSTSRPASVRSRSKEEPSMDLPPPIGVRRPHAQHSASMRSAKSFSAELQPDSSAQDSSASDDDMYASSPAVRRAPSVSSERSRRSTGSKRRNTSKGAALGGATGGAAAAAPALKRSSSRGSRASRQSRRREPITSDDEQRSLRAGSVKTASIFDEPPSDPDTEEEQRQKTARQPVTLGAIERHYLNKALLCLQMQREWSALSQIGALALYGSPFLNHPTGPQSKPAAIQKDGGGGLFASLPFIGGGGAKMAVDTTRNGGYQSSTWDKPTDPPILRYLFWRFIKNLPALNEAKPEYWTDRIQPFFDSFAERNFSVTRERGEVTKRRLLAMGFTRLLGTYMGAAITALGESAPSRPDKALMIRVDLLFPGSMQAMHRILCGKSRNGAKSSPNYNAWVAIPAGGGTEDDKVYTLITRVLASEERPVFVTERALDGFRTFADKLENISENNLLQLPLIPISESADLPDRLTLQRWLRTIVITLSNPPVAARDTPQLNKARVQLERFLLDRPMKNDDRRQRELLDQARRDDDKLEQDRAAWQAAGKRGRELRTTWSMYRDALIGARELDKSWGLVRRYDRIKDLPKLHRDAEEWARLWVGYALHYLYKASPQAEDLFNLTKSFHGLIPYGLLKQGLRIANPTLMIKFIVNAVLGQPMGQASLFQRIFSIVMGGEIKRRTKDVAEFRESINETRICEIVEGYVYAPRSTQEKVRQISYEEDEDIIICLLREGDLGETTLSDVQDWRDAFVESGLTTDDAFVESGRRRRLSADARRYLQIKGLLRALCIKRDREQVLEIVMEPNTPALLKASISVFYNAIYRVAEASNLAERLSDLQAFLDDLVKVAEAKQSDTSDFIKLCARHEQSLWFFIHELIAYGDDLMDPLKEWSRSGLGLLKAGLPDKSTSRSSRRLGADVDHLLSRADNGTRHEIVREIRGLATYTRLRKAQADIWLRCDLLALDDRSPLQVDSRGVVAQFTEEEREAVDYIESSPGGVQPEAGVAWAWFGEADILDNGGDVRSDWRKVAKQTAREAAGDQAAKKKKNKKGKKGKKGDDVETSRMIDVLDQGSLLPPPPRLLATKTLLEPWIQSLKRSLDAAKEAKIR